MSEIAIREIDAEEYAIFLDTAPHSAFHRPSLLKVVSQVFGVRLRLLGYFRKDRLVAVTPLMGRRMGPFLLWGAPLRKCGIPAATPFCSPSERATDCLPVLNAWRRQHRFGYVQITLPGEVMIEPSAIDRVEPLDNLELDLDRPLVDVWKSLSDLPRRCVRKAMRQGVRIHWQNAEGMLAIQRDLLHDTYERQGIQPNYPDALYQALLASRQSVGLRILCATYEDKVVSAIWVFDDARSCYYWDAASLDEARELNANHLLVWCLIRWAHRRSFKTLDFVGGGQGRDGNRPGIGRFKQSMGGCAVNYKLLYWYSPLMRLAFVGYRLFNRLRLRTRSARDKHHAQSV